MKVALYIRVSTDEQAREGTSIDEQKARLSAFAQVHGWTDHEFFVDEGYSAKDFNRPSFSLLKRKVEDREIGAVITTKIDRLTRRLIDLMQFVDFLDKHECIYKSASESFDTGSAAGRMVLQLLGVFAEFERERIAERVRDNMHHLAKQGKPISRPCFGYDLVDKKLVINQDEAQWVHKMAYWFLGGNGTFQIAKLLNDNNVRTKNGGQWSAKSVRQFLNNNQMLIGNLVWNKQLRKGNKRIQNPSKDWLTVENTHPPLLQLNVYTRIQEKLQQSSRRSSPMQKFQYLLSGLVRCGHCGARMIGSSSRYICSGYQKKGLCFNHWIAAKLIEPFILEKLYHHASHSPLFLSNLNHHIVPTRKWKTELQQAKRNLSQIDEKIRRQLQAYEANIINLDDLKEAKFRLENEKEHWLTKCKNLEKIMGNTITNDLNSMIPVMAEKLMVPAQAQLFTYQQNIIRELVHEITVYNGEEVAICYLA